VFPIYVPSLQERLADLPMLANNFLRQTDAEPYYLTESAITRLKQHRYRGNIRELRNLLLRAKVLTNTNVIDRTCIERSLSLSGQQTDSPVNDSSPEDLSLDAAARRHLQYLLTHFTGDKERAAAAAGISVRSLYRRLSNADE
jgi:DNA-binding NtrC family response regulator